VRYFSTNLGLFLKHIRGPASSKMVYNEYTQQSYLPAELNDDGAMSITHKYNKQRSCASCYATMLCCTWQQRIEFNNKGL